MLCVIKLLVLNLVLKPVASKPQENDGEDYLKSVISKLQNERAQLSFVWKVFNEDRSTEQEHGTRTIMGPTPLPPVQPTEGTSETQQNKQTLPPPPPPQPLSKEELTALYQTAVKKGAILDLASMTSGSVQGIQALKDLFSTHNTNKGSSQEEQQGYYYYFYPIKNFDPVPTKANEVKHGSTTTAPSKPAAQTPSMVPTAMMIVDSGTDKSVEPLFMAIAGFVGMALMFAFSVLFMPKFGNLRSRGITAPKQGTDGLSALTTLILDGIDGKNCNHRIACEVGRAMRKLQRDKESIRILEILLPPFMQKHRQTIRKAEPKKGKCNFIPCKRKGTRDF